MATFLVTQDNWNDPLFWAAIDEGSGDHALDFSGLPATYSIDASTASGKITISDGTDTFVVGDAGAGGTLDARMGGSTDMNDFAVTGTAGEDTIDGSSGSDTLSGGDGNDELEGFSGNDTLVGGLGDDTFRIEGTDDGLDHFDGGDGYDVIEGTHYNDNFYVTSGLSNLSGIEAIDGGSGGYDAIYGTSGDDVLDFSSGPALINIDEIDGGAGNDSIIGTDGNDFIEGNAGNDTLVGGLGDDTFRIEGTGDGLDHFDGGDGYDVIEGTHYSDNFYVTSGLSNLSGIEAIDGGSDGYDRVYGTSGDDVLDFSSGPALINIDEIDGGYGNDSIIGTDGNDFIEGNAGNDTLVGGLGDDTFRVYGSYAGTDHFEGGDGYDVVEGTSASDTFYVTSGLSNLSGIEAIDGGSGGYDRIYGTSGDDVLDFSSGPALINIDEIDGGYGNDSIIGTDGNDFIEGNAGNDTLVGGLGDDTFRIYGWNVGIDHFEGGDGYDVIEGTSSNDYFYVRSGLSNLSGIEAIDGGSRGYDAIYGTSGDDVLDFSSGPALINIDEIDGGSGNDSIIGTANADTIDGGSGHDTLHGGTGNDYMRGGWGDDVIHGESGRNTLSGEGGNDTLHGGTGNDYLAGGSDEDVLYGTSGDNTLSGGSGNDTLYGGTDTDTAVFSGRVSEYYFERLADGRLQVIDKVSGRDGTDTLDGVEKASFAGTTYTIVRGDDASNLGLQLADNGESALIIGHGDADSGIGRDTHDALIGGEGSDTLDGAGGGDYLDGEGGDDILNGEAGNDTIAAGAGNDLISGGDDSDRVVVEDGFGADTVTGGEGGSDFDAIDLSDLSHAVTVTYSGDGAGSLTDATDTIDFSEIEHLILTEHADTVNASADGLGVRIDALGGADTILGGSGGDTVDGGSGNDTIEGAAGSDVLSGGSGDDTVHGDADGDELRFYSDHGNDIIVGGETGVGDDTLSLGNAGSASGAHVVFTGDEAGNVDFASAGGSAVFSEIEAVRGTSRDDDLDATATTMGTSLDGADGDDTLRGGTGDDLLDGGGDDDTFVMSDGYASDTIIGGSGSDTIDMSGLSNAVTVDFTGNSVGTATDGSSTLDFSESEQLILTEYDDRLDGTADSVGFGVEALGGDDSLLGGSGDDTIDAGDGADTVYGGAGNDRIELGEEGAVGDSDLIFGGAGNDTITSAESDAASADTVDGGDGDDHISMTGGTNSLSGGAGNDTILGGDGADTIDGGGDNDYVRGGEGDDVLYGGAATDTAAYTGTVDQYTFERLPDGRLLITDNTADRDGADTLDGFEKISFAGKVYTLVRGDETSNLDLQSGTPSDPSLVLGHEDDDWGGGHATDDALFGGAGSDTLDAGAGDDYVDGETGDDLLRGDAGNDTVLGRSGDDTLEGGTGDDILDGGDGADTFNIADNFGDDTITGGEGGTDTDALNASAHGGPITVTYADEAGSVTDGSDTLTFTGIEALTLSDHGDVLSAGGDSTGITVSGGAGDDSLVTGSGADVVDGGDGDDTIDGGSGDDLLTGGDGDDVFRYAAGGGQDTITDFNFGNSGALEDDNPDNNDFVDLSGFYDRLDELRADQADDGILNQSNTTTLNGKAVDYSDNDQFGTGSLILQGATPAQMTTDNTGVICFAAGTSILTPHGEVPVEELRIGDAVCTMDNGPQTIAWIGCRSFGMADLALHPELRPVVIRSGILGATRDLLVSRQHGVVVERDHFARAGHLADHCGGVRIARGRRQVTYVHILFEAHQVVFANGVASESFFPGELALSMMPLESRKDLFLSYGPVGPIHRSATGSVNSYGMPARPYMKRSAVAQHYSGEFLGVGTTSAQRLLHRMAAAGAEPACTAI